MYKKNKTKAQNGYISPWENWMTMYNNGYINNQMQPIDMQGTLPEVTVSAQGIPANNRYGIQQIQPLPIDKPQGQQFTQRPASMNYTPQQPTTGMSAGTVAGGISSIATGIGNVFDVIGDIQRGIITGGSALLNALIPDNNKPKQRALQFVNSQDPYGAQQVNNMYENGGNININPNNRGLFTKKANTHNMSVQEYADYVLNHKDNFPLRTERQAQFAKNFAEDGIHIKPSHKGDFTEWSKRHGWTVEEAENHVLTNKEDYSPHIIQMANFSNNARSWNKAESGATVSPEKAKKILRDGEIRGKKLTAKQKRFFGWQAGGAKEAANGAVVTDYGFGDVPNLTPAQRAALEGTIPYTTPIERIQPIQVQTQPYEYFSPNTDGTFAINVNRYLQDRTANWISPYDTSTNRSYAYEGAYGNRWMQNGGLVNNTGYLDNSPTANNPVNIIPSNFITMDGVSQPIMANGIPLPPNSGNYLFPTESVIEQNMYQAGKTYDLDEKTISELKKLGYDIEIQ